jgi:hypothetical protein
MLQTQRGSCCFQLHATSRCFAASMQRTSRLLFAAASMSLRVYSAVRSCKSTSSSTSHTTVSQQSKLSHIIYGVLLTGDKAGCSLTCTAPYAAHCVQPPDKPQKPLVQALLDINTRAGQRHCTTTAAAADTSDTGSGSFALFCCCLCRFYQVTVATYQVKGGNSSPAACTAAYRPLGFGASGI